MDKRKIEEAILTILKEIGEDPNRDGLLETPKRVAKAYEELFEGYKIKDEDFLYKQFETTYT
ncbi:MAG: GTP cyclohydrolase I, partial [Candidatus Ureaplasma intestinipullorum]|nr:GTP cyclohydrolase I [Candidatus Ureaplasma intestinipullorum]